MDIHSQRKKSEVGSDADAVTQAIDNLSGFRLLLAGANAWLEHGIQLNLVPQPQPGPQRCIIVKTSIRATWTPVMHSNGDVTRLLTAWSDGDKQALEELIPLVYAELHRIARRCWSGQSADHTLQPTVLIHEAYLKLASQSEKSFDNRAQFFALASMAMRQVLVNHAKARLTEKRGGKQVTVSVDDIEPAQQREAREVLSLNDALKTLETFDPRKSRVVELRYFGGLSIEETAEALNISTITVTRDWQAARAWLARELGAENSNHS